MPPHRRKSGTDAAGEPVGTCPDCGKGRFHTRKDARTAARRLDGGERINAYRCGDWWHWGHASARDLTWYRGG